MGALTCMRALGLIPNGHSTDRGQRENLWGTPAWGSWTVVKMEQHRPDFTVSMVAHVALGLIQMDTAQVWVSNRP
jgi:hypothetical protein